MTNHCPHPQEKREVRRFKKGEGSVFAFQCLDCFQKIGRNIRPDDLPGGMHPKDVPWKSIRPQFSGPGNSKRREFKAYLGSAAWKKLREKVLHRDNFTCQDCGDPATDAGHITYERFGNELLSDLKAQCFDCNQAEREQRISGGHAA